MAVHLVAVSHGMWGTTSHMDSLVAALKLRGAEEHKFGDETPQSDLIVYRVHTNPGYFTYDGVDVCGSRAAAEIIEEISNLAALGTPVTQLSLAGFSMGGLIMRYAAGVLYNRNIFDSIEPKTFTTFASPHVGVNVLGNTRAGYWFNFIGSYSMARTSRQAFLCDEYHGRNVPLFVHMTEEGSPYFEALKLFEQRAMYANIVNDARCEYYTAASEPIDPFRGVAHLVSGPYASRFGPVVLQGCLPELKSANQGAQVVEKHAGLLSRLVERCKFMFRAGFVIPIWFSAFLINAGYQGLASFFRTYRYIKDKKHLIPYYETTMDNFIQTNARTVVDNLYSALGNQQSNKLELSTDMELIIARLNSLKWRKYPVHITRTLSAHSALIARNTADPQFQEGKLVLAHWAEEVLDLPKQPRPNI